MRRYILVFPNRRARLFFNFYLSSLSDKPVWSPQYFTISDFIREFSGLNQADPLSLLFKLYGIYKKVTGSEEKFDDFYYYCEMMLADFDDIDKYRIDPDMLYANLSDLKALDDFKDYLSEYQIRTIRQFWESFQPPSDSPGKQSFMSLWDAMPAIYRLFNEELDKEGIAYEGKAYRAAISRLEAGYDPSYQGKTLVFVGFNALNLCEENLFDRLSKTTACLFFWDFDKSYLDSELHEAGHFLRKYIRKYPPPPDFDPNTSKPANQKTETVAVPSDIAQAKVIGQCLDKLDTANISLPGNTAIILADEGLLLPVVNSLPDFVDRVNISLGYPVTDSPVFSFLTILTDLHKNRNISDNDKRVLFYHRDFFAVINHFFMQHIRNESSFKEFESMLLEQNYAYIQAAMYKSMDPLYKAVFSKPEGAHDFGKYLLDIVGLVAENLLTSVLKDKELKWQMEVLQAIHKVLVRFNLLLKSFELELSFSTVLNLLRQIMAGVSVPFSGEPLTGLQIMGILETRNLDFENIIILSVNEGKFPKAGHAPSMIPYSLREGFGLPTVKHQDAIFAYYFYRLLSRSKHTILVYNTKTEGLQKGEPSRFIAQLRFGSTSLLSHSDAVYKVSTIPATELKAGKTENVLHVLAKFSRPDGKSMLSPSALNTYINCKLRFYFRYVEGMKEAEDIGEEIEANVFGSILHHAMEILYSPMKGKLVTRQTIEKLIQDKQIVHAAIDTAFNKEFRNFGEKPVYQGNILLIRQVIEKYILGLLDHDSRNSPFRIVDLEGKRSIEVRSGEPGMNLLVGGIIDRIDEFEGRIRIVDYKTGGVSPDFGSLAELFEAEPGKRNSAVFQTFVYAWILLRSAEFEEVQPALFFIRDIYKPDFQYTISRSEQRKKLPVQGFSEYFGEFEERLINLLTEIFDSRTEFTQTSDVSYCATCPFNTICMRTGVG
jgi:hypothetical protein